ncbi:LacI family transcriptional regulator [Paenibacillus sp. CC-CFT747]|nr:LacI family transcriptional regulator [Paenibacillus sp. CC-CFT747]
MNNKQITIVEVAREAGVSIATVSNVLNKRNVPMAPETAAKVEEAAARLGYRRNTVAASLSRRKTNELGLLLPGFGGYYGQFAEAMELTAHRHGYHLSVYATGSDPEREQRHLETLLERRVDGLFCHGMAMKPESVGRIVRGGSPLVLFNAWEWPEDLAVAAVNLDFAGASAEAVRHLVERGCQTVYYAGTSKALMIDRQRRLGFRREADRLGAEVRTGMIQSVAGDPEERVTAAAAGALAEGGPVGILAFDDRVALRILGRLLEAGIRVPEEVKLLGINNEWFSAAAYPALTSMSIPYEKQAELAIHRLLSHLGEAEDGKDLPQAKGEVTVPLELTPRRSTEA